MEDVLGANKQAVAGVITLLVAVLVYTPRFKTKYAKRLWARGCDVREVQAPEGVKVHNRCPPGVREEELERMQAAEDEYQGEQLARRRGGFDGTKIETPFGKRSVVQRIGAGGEYAFTAPRPSAPHGEWWVLNPQRGWIPTSPSESRALRTALRK